MGVVKKKALLLENIHSDAVSILEKNGFEVETRDKSLTEDELISQLEGVSVLGIRSNTKLTKEVIDKATDLEVVGAFCVGTNQIDLKAAASRGVVVFNAPYANTRSVVELTMAEIIMLARRLPERNFDMHAGLWEKSADRSFEVRGKTLGIIGYGNIGSQLSTLAEAAGMNVLFYDTSDKLALGNAKKCVDLGALLERSDVVTIHVDGRPENKLMMGQKEFSQMKEGALFINNSRGHVVDVEALAASLKSGRLGGAAVDVFPDEPSQKGYGFESSLRGLKNTMLTPHIGGSTREAQVAIAEFVASKLSKYISSGDTKLSVNLPEISLGEPLEGYCRIGYVHQNVPGVLAQVNTILLEAGINITGQHLATRDEFGYVVIETEGVCDESLLQTIRNLDETIYLRAI